MCQYLVYFLLKSANGVIDTTFSLHAERAKTKQPDSLSGCFVLTIDNY
jgi:hypothetical protein